MSFIEPTDVNVTNTTTTTKKKDGTTTTTTTRKTNIGSGDIAVALVFLLCLTFFLMSIFIKPWRGAVSHDALPALLGVFTLAVGGVAAYKLVLGKK